LHGRPLNLKFIIIASFFRPPNSQLAVILSYRISCFVISVVDAELLIISICVEHRSSGLKHSRNA
jgi:hypothetical protein